MARKFAVLVSLLTFCCMGLVACGGREQSAPGGDIGEKGKEFVSLLADGKFEEAAARLAPTMAAAMPPAKLEEAWKSLSSFGAYESQSGVRSAKEQGFDVAYVTCAFEKGSVTVKVVFDQDGEVTGLWFV